MECSRGMFRHHGLASASSARDALTPRKPRRAVTFQGRSLETAKGEGRGIDGLPWDAAESDHRLHAL